jgi:hypothetical protein
MAALLASPCVVLPDHRLRWHHGPLHGDEEGREMSEGPLTDKQLDAYIREVMTIEREFAFDRKNAGARRRKAITDLTVKYAKKVKDED